ncbi:uncharacterized protein P884DRAFT_96224 [Thermothelomyces heterothallicus CBS 202.75]|uniref:uncharacterized protein n=1 Tax=Thermothelomyces heterothallicus CBS 202.75 TaxID=1149848 RepID=UPI0037430611
MRDLGGETIGAPDTEQLTCWGIRPGVSRVRGAGEAMSWSVWRATSRRGIQIRRVVLCLEAPPWSTATEPQEISANSDGQRADNVTPPPVNDDVKPCCHKPCLAGLSGVICDVTGTAVHYVNVSKSSTQVGSHRDASKRLSLAREGATTRVGASTFGRPGPAQGRYSPLLRVDSMGPLVSSRLPLLLQVSEPACPADRNSHVFLFNSGSGPSWALSALTPPLRI